MQNFDAIVVGAGGMGSAALHHLAARGCRVLGLEQFQIGHHRGSSHGQSRIIRKSYFENPVYVPLLHRAYELWAELEQATGRRLVHRTGLLLVGPPNGTVIPGVQRAAREHGLDIEDLPGGSVSARFTGFRVDGDLAAVYEPDAGYLAVERCVQAHVEAARKAGADIRTEQAVCGWSTDARGVTVETADETFRAGKLVLCGGAWSGQLVPDLPLPLTIRRKMMLWYEADDCYREDRGCPVFGFETGGGFFYGFPIGDDRRMKLAEHTGGETCRQASSVDGSLRPADRRGVEEFMARHLPGVVPELRHHAVCMYTMTPDEHFVIDRHPQHESVFFAAGFSGHGFKFAPLVGSVLADLACDGRTREPIEFLSARRAALRARSPHS